MKRIAICVLLLICSAALLFPEGRSVLVKLNYPTLSTEVKKYSDGKTEEITKNLGFSDFALQIRDLTCIKISEKGYIGSIDLEGHSDYTVTLHVVTISYNTGYLYSIEVEVFKNPTEKYVSRKLFKGFTGSVNIIDDISDQISLYLKDVAK